MRPTKQWPPEIDAIISNPAFRASIKKMVERIQPIMPDVTHGMVKWRRSWLRAEKARQEQASRWDPAVYTKPRAEYLKQVWGTDMPFAEIKAVWNALPGDPISAEQRIYDYASHLGLSRPTGPGTKGGRPRKPSAKTGKGIYNSTDQAIIDRMIRRGSDAFGEAFSAAGLWFDDHPDLSPAAVAPVQRRGIMTGPDPRTADLIAARVAMAARSRLAVADVGVRGLV